MTRKRFHGLKRVKIRQTWNKYNLYNITRLQTQGTAYQTFYQQKWKAKSITRAYHGEHIREKHWQRMFRSTLHAVVPLNHKYLAEHDGSELASGRGSGREQPFDPSKVRFGQGRIPYMHMTYAPTERRLDTAIFRALFASSARQARQFVIHGKVKVNGKKMPYPGYLLNPGDMFQVDPDRVLYATGLPKPREQARRGRALRRSSGRKKVAKQKREKPKRKAGLKKAEPELVAETEGIPVAPLSEPAVAESHRSRDLAEIRKERKEDLKEIMNKIDRLLENKRNPPSAKRKIDLRAFHKNVRIALAQVNRKPINDLAKEYDEFIGRLAQYTPSQSTQAQSDQPEAESAQSEESEPSPEEQKALREAIARIRENPVDETKPYATPWSPRPYMSAFAFIPRYLEVNHNICSAVYLRHPVARPGLAEVPSPFPAETQQLAFNWYLRRR